MTCWWLMWCCLQVEADSGDEIVFCDMDLDKIADFRSSIPTEQQKRCVFLVLFGTTFTFQNC